MPAAEELILDLKQQLARELVAIMDGWDQCEAAALLRLRQPDISLLRAGKLDRFSVTRLLQLIASRQYHIDLTLRPTRAIVRREVPRASVARLDVHGRPADTHESRADWHSSTPRRSEGAMADDTLIAELQ